MKAGFFGMIKPFGAHDGVDLSLVCSGTPCFFTYRILMIISQNASTRSCSLYDSLLLPHQTEDVPLYLDEEGETA